MGFFEAMCDRVRGDIENMGFLEKCDILTLTGLIL